MQNETIVFPRAYYLWKYKEAYRVRHFKVNFIMYTLVGIFKKEDIEVAVNDYKARLIQKTG